MKRFNHFAHNQFKILKTHLEAYRENPDAEGVHQIRVDIKKIKAVLETIGACRKSFKMHRQYVPFRTVFRSADIIRRLDLFHTLASETEAAIPTSTAAEDGPCSDFSIVVDRFAKKIKKRKRKIEPWLRGVHKKPLRRFLKRLQKQIRCKLYPHLSITDIHKTRKSVKTVLYIAQATHSLKKEKIHFFNALQESIGMLHDNQLLLATSTHAADRHAAKVAITHGIRKIKAMTVRFYRPNPNNVHHNATAV
ncbi:CHAD domain-containing protein [Chryseolinea lacunae]|uniref:CHAD domain-containing protein n=1 Tax=Chryseolinea lacunae TaxID=2801331 RepID=A0ABS1KQS3_9BACT|nr:CHAD domain-containing protein [Chryseolinea lacunae]MBL0741037.1 CHAD domain-containing protein [Chryseolinea lacunae]